jgi:hypothetical protein
MFSKKQKTQNPVARPHFCDWFAAAAAPADASFLIVFLT